MERPWVQTVLTCIVELDTLTPKGINEWGHPDMTEKLLTDRLNLSANKHCILYLYITDESKKSDICAVLQFLLRLKDTGGTACQGVVGHTENKLPVLQKRVGYKFT